MRGENAMAKRFKATVSDTSYRVTPDDPISIGIEVLHAGEKTPLRRKVEDDASEFVGAAAVSKQFHAEAGLAGFGDSHCGVSPGFQLYD